MYLKWIRTFSMYDYILAMWMPFAASVLLFMIIFYLIYYKYKNDIFK